jgi:hypothetical protein
MPKGAVTGMSRNMGLRTSGAAGFSTSRMAQPSAKSSASPTARDLSEVIPYLRCISRGFVTVDSTSAIRFKST